LFDDAVEDPSTLTSTSILEELSLDEMTCVAEPFGMGTVLPLTVTCTLGFDAEELDGSSGAGLLPSTLLVTLTVEKASPLSGEAGVTRGVFVEWELVVVLLALW
jgi:hypothetical protein